MNEKTTLAVDDLHAASYVATRCRLLQTSQNGTRTVFFFDDTDGRASAASIDFVNGPSVNLREFLAAFRELKSVAYAARQRVARINP